MVWSVDLQTIANRIRHLLSGDGVQHVRVIGEPGLGKTRLVLEALRGDERLSSAAVYAPQASDFQESRFFGELLKLDRQYQVALVVDECDERERGSIYGRFKGRPGIKLITIDHGPESSADHGMEVLQMPPLKDAQIQEVLSGYVGKGAGDLHRWAQWCDGSARVAHALGENLKPTLVTCSDRRLRWTFGDGSSTDMRIHETQSRQSRFWSTSRSSGNSAFATQSIRKAGSSRA